MATQDDARKLALSLPDAVESQHFENADFRIRNKIFAALPGETTLTVRLTPDEQAELLAENPDAFHPAPGAWGRRGWTLVTLSEIDAEQVGELLTDAWRHLAPKRLRADFDASLERD
ncbi:MmcQ/YjbR family DNA-binding protein [Amycolatopsis sp. CA-230715]|uniref:MmcQ/YjbR family DNA-binding protein n=1 Tax=Amycolatopsis sp. CA-230715 TaxID=2745196 RepID=UPI001C030C0B|nr:MmcQ/YjbR family DNA-binding protein [Amycolatopsis sp. CA-230715]QWF84815.1 hypothetical protein HUW46_08267 [Amycolatopsis sp. CA-230715]